MKIKNYDQALQALENLFYNFKTIETMAENLKTYYKQQINLSKNYNMMEDYIKGLEDLYEIYKRDNEELKNVLDKFLIQIKKYESKIEHLKSIARNL